MEKLDIVITLMVAGYGLVLSLLLIIWNSLNQKIDANADSSARRDDALANRIERLDEKITDIDRRLCRLEGAFMQKDCCMLKSDFKEKAVL